MNFGIYDNNALGPIQHDEAIFLYGLALTIAPRRVLEFGVMNGLSTRVWLEAGCNVTGIDLRLSEEAIALIDEFPGQLELREMDMQHTQPSDVPQDVDLVFWDASHVLSHSIAAYQALSDRACYHIVHDTGIWARATAPQHALSCFKGNADTLMHQPGEVAFCDYLQAQGLQRIDFNTIRKFRHGLTVLRQENKKIKRPGGHPVSGRKEE